jgi:lysophospholipase
MTALSQDYPAAAHAGLVMPGGEDVFVEAPSGRIRGHHWAAPDSSSPPRPSIVICPGFTEFCEKYAAVAARLTACGHDVLIVDWPGQGRSGHLGARPLSVHIDDFEDHLCAADALMAAAGFARRPVVFLGHSMGGHLALRLAARHMAQAIGAIILSPMIAPPVMPVWGVRLLAGAIVAAGFGRKPALGRPPRRLADERVFRVNNGLTRVQRYYEDQFLWFDDAPELRRSGPTAGWVRAAYDSCVATTLNSAWMKRLDLPVLALTSGDERIVHKPSIDRMLPCLPKCRHVSFEGARHELLFETDAVQTELWQRIESFLASLPT